METTRKRGVLLFSGLFRGVSTERGIAAIAKLPGAPARPRHACGRDALPPEREVIFLDADLNGVEGAS